MAERQQNYLTRCFLQKHVDCSFDGRRHSMLPTGPRKDPLRPLGQGFLATLRDVPFDKLLRAALREHGQLLRSHRRLVRIGAGRRDLLPLGGPVLATQRGVTGTGFASGTPRGRLRQLCGANLRHCGLSLGAALGAIRQELSCQHPAASPSSMSHAALCGSKGDSSGVRSHVLLEWRRKLAPQLARANGCVYVARGPSQGFRMRCLAATRCRL